MDEQGTNEDRELTLPPATVLTRPRPKALWGVLAAVAVAAAALAVTSGGGDSAAPLLPIALGGAAGTRSAAPGEADAALAWVTYVAGPDLPALGGEAPAYRLAGAVDEARVRSLADALGLAGDPVHDAGFWTVEGDDGATLQVYEGGGATWWFSAISPDVPMARSASGGGVTCAEAAANGEAVDCETVTTLAPLPYEECPPTADCSTEPRPQPELDCAQVEAGDCPEPAPVPPVDLPTEAEASAIALRLLSATGIDTEGAIVTVDGPYEAWYVTVEPRVDGVATGLVASVSVGSGGAITSAGGFVGTPERLGDYPLLDTRAAIDRLNEEMAHGGGYYGGVGMASDVMRGVVVEPAEAAVAPCASVRDSVTVPCEEPVEPPTTFPCKVQADGSEICEGSTPPGVACPELGSPADRPPGTDPAIECPPTEPVPAPEPLPAPEPMEIVLTGATPTLVLLPANDGSADVYLVPGYRFTGDNGEQVDAPAVADESLRGPATTTEPPVTGTVTVEPPVPDPGGTDPICETLVEGDGSGTTHTVQPPPDLCVAPELNPSPTPAPTQGG